MKCYQILFSPTGGTEKVAAAITQNWPGVQTIDLSSTSTDFASFFIESDSLVLVAMPSFGDVAPQLAIDRFAQINGNRAKCVLVAVYGNRAYGSTLVQMEDTANAAGFQVIAAISAIAEHSIIHEYAAGRPNAEDCKQLSAFGTKIFEKHYPAPWQFPPFPASVLTKNPAADLFPLLILIAQIAVCARRSVLLRRFPRTMARSPINPSAFPV